MGKEKTAAGADRQLKGLSGRLKTVSDRLSAVGTTAEKAVKRVSATVSAAAARSTKQVQSVATLLEFDEINRLKEKTVSPRSSGRRKSASSGKKTGTKTKTGPSAAGAFDLDLSLGGPAKKAARSSGRSSALACAVWTTGASPPAAAFSAGWLRASPTPSVA